MKQIIFSNWSFFRFLRLLIGIAVIVQAIIQKDMLFGMAGVLFTTMAVFNASCCGSGGCYTPAKKTVQKDQEISYEEVK